MAKTIQLFKNRHFNQGVVGGRPHVDRTLNKQVSEDRDHSGNSMKKIPKYKTHQDDDVI